MANPATPPPRGPARQAEPAADQLVEQTPEHEAWKRIRRSLKGLRTEASGAQDDLRKLQATLGARASAAYTQGAGSAVAAVLGSDDPAAAIARVQVLDLLAAHDGDLMDQLGVAGQAFDERQRNLVAAEKAQAAEVERLRPEDRVEQAADRTRTLLSGCSPPTALGPRPASSGRRAPPSGGRGGAAAARPRRPSPSPGPRSASPTATAARARAATTARG